jgi:hypothetical protein
MCGLKSKCYQQSKLLMMIVVARYAYSFFYDSSQSLHCKKETLVVNFKIFARTIRNKMYYVCTQDLNCKFKS